MPPITIPRETRTCARPACNETFVVLASNPKRLCSWTCVARLKQEAQGNARGTREERTRACAGCGAPFIALHVNAQQRFCGRGCGSRTVSRG